MKNLIYWFIIALLIAIFFGNRYQRQRKDLQMARKKYNEANKKYVESLNRKKELDGIAKAHTRAYFIYISIAVFSICGFLNTCLLGNSFFETIGFICTTLLVVMWCGVAMFGKTMTLGGFYNSINSATAEGIYRLNDYNPELLKVYSEKLEEARKEVFNAIVELRKSRPVWVGA